jgi:exodeoxyribonuclease VII small subunit
MTEEEVSKLSYEQALNELEKVVATLESGSAALDKSIELYTLGSILKDHCQKKLNTAQEKISVLVQKNGDTPIEIKPFPNT